MMSAAAPEKLRESLSVVIPTYKEARRLPATLRAVLDYLGKRFESFEVIVVDDNSPDGTGDIVREYAARMPQVRLIVQPYRIGKGAALRRGCLEAAGATPAAFHDDPLDDLNSVQRELDRLNTELGFLHPHPKREDLGKFTSEGRYRVWKEIWTLNYLGRAARYE